MSIILPVSHWVPRCDRVNARWLADPSVFRALNRCHETFRLKLDHPATHFLSLESRIGILAHWKIDSRSLEDFGNLHETLRKNI
jgi:hypothetical protein